MNFKKKSKSSRPSTHINFMWRSDGGDDGDDGDDDDDDDDDGDGGNDDDDDGTPRQSW